MVLASVQHHGALRGQTTATRTRGGGESHEMKYTAKFRKTPPPQAFFQLYDEEDAERGVRPAALVEPRPQGPVQRHTAQHIVDIVPYVQILDVPQMGGQLLDFMQNLDTPSLDEQVIAVPKISLNQIPQRSALRPTQKAEQLVEVPTIVSFSSLRGIVEQNVDIPVPRGRGRVGLGLHPGQSSTARLVEQNVDIEFPEEACMFSLILVALAHPQFHVMSAGTGFFALFPDFKKR